MPGPKNKHPSAIQPQAARKASVLLPTHESLLAASRLLTGLGDADELPGLLLDAAADLCGARRVLLVLDAPEGPGLAGSRVPASEDVCALLSAVTPWIVEARRTRKARLRHGPEGAAAVDQRSCEVAP
jgi:hypothetical protein